MSFAGTFMAFAMTFCPGIAWIVAYLPSNAIHVEFIDFQFSIWRIFLLLCASLSGITSLGLYFMPESPKFYIAQNENEKAVQVMAKIYQWNTKNPPQEYPVTEITLDENYLTQYKEHSFFKSMWKQTVPLIEKQFLLNTVRTSFLMFILFAASSGFYLWTPNILNTIMKNNTTDLGVCEIVGDVAQAKL